MDPSIYVKGLLIGFSIAAPVGPIGVLCIRQTLISGRIAGFITGLGAATADSLYGCIAGFGLTIVSGFFINQRHWLQLAGGFFLVYLGVKTFFARPKAISLYNASPDNARGFLGDYVITFFLTLTNPLTILSFIAIFAGLGLGTTSSTDYMSAIILVAGVFSGSTAWWFLLSFFVGLFKTKFDHNLLVWLNRVSGTIITGFGLFALINLV